MNAIQNFEKQAGGRWTGITLYQGTIPEGRLADRPMKLCEAIKASVMAVCGWGIAGAQVNQAVSLSFGCPESRKACAMGNDRLIIGLPSELAKKLGS